MEPVYLVAAFFGGLIALIVRLPPLVGFLVAGFLLNAFGFPLTPSLQTIADIGVTLLLFSIGLKLDVRSLLRQEIWGTATIHMLGSSLLMMGFLGLLKLTGLGILRDSDWTVLALLGFSLSFSSTVFVVKVLEKRSEAKTAYGRLAIGILIMQDIFAVIFITASKGDLPEPMALALLLLIPLAPLLQKLLAKLGHGEMQMIFAMSMALVAGYHLFEYLGIKGDLGALIVGLLLAPHPAAQSLARSLFDLKELLLVAFFLSIGMTATPNWEALGLALLIVVAVPIKTVLYITLFTRYRLRQRTSILATLVLSNYSEFGLIVGALATQQGLLGEQWLVILSLAVAISFVFSSLLNTVNETLYRHIAPRLPAIPQEQLDPGDRPIEVGDAQAVVLGMGRIGRSVYRRLQKHYGLRVLGIDSNPHSVNKLQQEGYRLMEGDALDSDFWDKLLVSPDVELVVLAMPHHAGNLFALDQLRDRDFQGHITAIVEYPEEIEPIRTRGANAVHHIYDEAGRSLADSAAEEAGLVSATKQLG
ncbi:cation:proton antiporter family protein [Aidingimonas halophila]|uniref:Transporter, CPA2 family n=1 Tax=Aidingimonas halophila TaxID=574349 RepID=A0A1H3F233_9GAMM|nr:cation:proton antiporter family protein [Aidingimonas halophila]GHC32194.1 potassium transporter Kef [Aidingimonas halophila]SDX84925.1 transporter, CPA2 family [Aidingimonas halophila]